jgi:PilZ domain
MFGKPSTKETTTGRSVRLSYDFRSREQVEEFINLDDPEPTVFLPTLHEVTLGHLIELDLGLTGQKARYQLQGRARWLRRGGSGPRLLPGVCLACDPASTLTLQQIASEARFHSFLFTRADPRLPCAASVRVHLRGRVSTADPVPARLGDLSHNGAFVVLGTFPQTARDPEAPPLLLEFAIDKAEQERPVVACNVRWIGFLNGQKGFGCLFLSPDKRVRGEVNLLLQAASGMRPPR